MVLRRSSIGIAEGFFDKGVAVPPQQESIVHEVVGLVPRHGPHANGTFFGLEPEDERPFVAAEPALHVVEEQGIGTQETCRRVVVVEEEEAVGALALVAYLQEDGDELAAAGTGPVAQGGEVFELPAHVAPDVGVEGVFLDVVGVGVGQRGTGDAEVTEQGDIGGIDGIGAAEGLCQGAEEAPGGGGRHTKGLPGPALLDGLERRGIVRHGRCRRRRPTGGEGGQHDDE